MSRLRLVEMPFLAATLAMVLTLTLPWAFGGAADDGGEAIEVAVMIPGAIPPESDAAGLQLAGVTPEGVTQQ